MQTAIGRCEFVCIFKEGDDENYEIRAPILMNSLFNFFCPGNDVYDASCKSMKNLFDVSEILPYGWY